MVATAVTAVTTATTAATAATATVVSMSAAAAFGIVAVVLLIVLLVSKELANASENIMARRLSRAINIATVPLLFTFCVITVTKVIAAIG
jgi:hypothetical protein